MISPYTEIQNHTLISSVFAISDQKDVSDVIYGQENHVLPQLLKLGLDSNRLPNSPILVTRDWQIEDHVGYYVK